ncbi:hypothetical protein B7463_g5687, partial [Scytalidium lignicola]
MFYSYEILTSRKYGVSTVWLVATLGAKSNSKRLNRKAILEVDVRKACQTIIEPNAPLALRLQSNLLYGVSRVYSQQCGYVLADAQVAQNHIRSLLHSARDDKLVQDAGKANPNQLILQDDPAFALDQALPPLNLDFSMLDILGNDTQRSILSISPHTQLNSTPPPHGSVLRLNIPSSSAGAGAAGTTATYQLPIHDAFKGSGDASSLQKGIVGGTGGFFEDEEHILFDDSTFEFDADGNFREILAPEDELHRGGQSSRIGGDHLANSRPVHREHVKDAGSRVLHDQIDVNKPVDYDEIELLPDAEPLMTGAVQGANVPRSDPSFTLEQSSDTAVASAKRRHQRQKRLPKRLAMDEECQVTKATLMEWQEGYIENMTKAKEAKFNNRQRVDAKNRAYEFVLGNGINNVGRGYGSEKFLNRLYMFSGSYLMPDIMGTSLRVTGKHPRDEESSDSEDSETRRVRTRQDQDEEQLGRGAGYHDDDMMMSMGIDDSGEVGRDAASALQDYASSFMPWNISASVNSHTHGRSSSLALRGIASSQLGSQHGNRLPSASPLVGRGTTLPADLITYGRDDDEDRTVLTEDDDAILRRATVNYPFPLLSSNRSAGSGAGTSNNGVLKDYDIFGPAAAVDTQTASSSQWIKQVLDREAGNFFDYVWNSIEEKNNYDDDEDHYGASTNDEQKWHARRYISFEELFAPGDHSPVVAAQAFYHVLTLATKGVVLVEQDIPEGDEREPLPFGEIRIGVFPPNPVSQPLNPLQHAS